LLIGIPCQRRSPIFRQCTACIPRPRSPRSNATLANAAKVFLGFRGDGEQGWPIAWRIGTWARLLDGNHAMTEVKLLLSDAGVYRSLLGKNLIFQIDANLGGTGTMIEMFLQSHNGILHILPALPAELSQGTITGLRARGGYTVNLSWNGGNLSQAVVMATINNAKTMQVRLGNSSKSISLQLGKGASRTFTPSDF